MCVGVLGMHPVELLKMEKSAFNSSRKKLGLPLESVIILPGILGLGWEEEDKATALPAAGFLTPHFPVSAQDKTLVHRLHPLCCSWNRQLCSLPRMRNRARYAAQMICLHGDTSGHFARPVESMVTGGYYWTQ